MKDSTPKTATKTALSLLIKAFSFTAKLIGGIILGLLPLSFFQMAIDYHWLVGIPFVVMMGLAAYFGIDDLQKGRVDTVRGIATLCSILTITISIFGFLSFVLNRFGLAHYQGFDPRVINEARLVFQTLINSYTWELFELVPGVRINEAFGSIDPPLRRSGFWAGVLVLGFRVVLVFIVLDIFRKWWVARGKSKTPAD